VAVWVSGVDQDEEKHGRLVGLGAGWLGHVGRMLEKASWGEGGIRPKML
jgi:hypothetical protein